MGADTDHTVIPTKLRSWLTLVGFLLYIVVDIRVSPIPLMGYRRAQLRIGVYLIEPLPTRCIRFSSSKEPAFALCRIPPNRNVKPAISQSRFDLPTRNKVRMYVPETSLQLVQLTFGVARSGGSARATALSTCHHLCKFTYSFLSYLRFPTHPVTATGRAYSYVTSAVDD
ncbi:hypothetical protein F4679DRAFT_507009 [Xylaria curta]|nr:hypothetical protein F4679DRAFT_507009 [Xylaria curta]